MTNDTCDTYGIARSVRTRDGSATNVCVSKTLEGINRGIPVPLEVWWGGATKGLSRRFSFDSGSGRPLG